MAQKFLHLQENTCLLTYWIHVFQIFFNNSEEKASFTTWRVIYTFHFTIFHGLIYFSFNNIFFYVTVEEKMT